MNCNNFRDELNINITLDEKKQQTDYKIKYVVEYVNQWLLVNVNRPDIININFVDCMCNAGIYQDGDLCTSMEVLILFMDEALLHQDKDFNIFINDYNQGRLDLCRQIADKLLKGRGLNNVNVFASVADVNDYLRDYMFFDKHFKYGSASIFFVDPYNFGTVLIKRLTDLVKRYYCELIFNLFTSDYVRNGIDVRIEQCIGDVANISNKEELVTCIKSQLKVGHIKYVFAYQFRTSTNTELYQIIYATPHIKGLIVLKEVLWKVFNGAFYHRNHADIPGQMLMFSEEEERQYILNEHATRAKDLLIHAFSGMTVDYPKILLFLMENTMIMEGDIIRSVLKPLIADELVEKKGRCNKGNFKKDEYKIKANKKELGN